MVRFRTHHLVLLLCLAGRRLPADQLVAAAMVPGARLYVAPMEWNLDQFVLAEIRKQGLSMELAGTPDQADFVMTSLYQKLGSHMISPGHYIQVQVVAAGNGKPVWKGEVNDFAIFFGRLRAHGPRKAAQAIVKKLRARLQGR